MEWPAYRDKAIELSSQNEIEVASLFLVSVATVFYSLRMYLNENNVVK